MTRSPETSSARPVAAAVLTAEGRALLGHRHRDRDHSDAAWDLPGGRVEPGESPQTAVRRHLSQLLGARVDVGDHEPDFYLPGEQYDVSLWVVRAWEGEVANCAPDEFDTLGWFAADELGSVKLAHAMYLRALSSVLTGGRARLEWSQDGAAITKTLGPGVVVPQWASLLGTPRQAALNELRVNRLLVRVPPPVRAPRLLAASRRGPSLTFEAVHGAPLGPKFPRSLSPADIGSLAGLALALDGYRPRRRWFRRLYIGRRLAVHCRAGLLDRADADALAALAGRPGLKWGFGHGDITARNVLRDTESRLALIDWEWGGLYPRGYDLAFLWFSLADVPGGRATVEAVLPGGQEAGFLLSAALVHLLHLQLWLRTPNPFREKHEQALKELMRSVRSKST